MYVYEGEFMSRLFIIVFCSVCMFASICSSKVKVIITSRDGLCLCYQLIKESIYGYAHISSCRVWLCSFDVGILATISQRKDDVNLVEWRLRQRSAPY